MCHVKFRRRKISGVCSQGGEKYLAYTVKEERNIWHIQLRRREISGIYS
jgi:hypothetical protein